ncbi:MAG: right-handed parallel beta-helix repeat-containing protein, partial [Planctomycetota bacterium]
MRCLILVSFMFSAAMATAAPLDIHVPGDYPAIQLAIDAALDGDTIIVAPGTYYENIDFIGKGITVMGEQGPELTVIDGMQASSVVRFLNSESESSLLQGFTLTHGIGYLVSSITYGGGVFCGTRCRPTLRDLIIKGNEAGKGGGVYSLTSAPTLEHCIISGNEATVWGSGLYCQDGSEMKLIHCTVTENFTENSGGGMYCDCASPSIVNCIFSDNIANVWGAGIYSNYGDHKLTITNVTFVRNGSSKPGSGIYSRSNAQITNSIFWNYGPSEIVLNAKATFDVTYSLVRGGWPGNHNIDEHPGFLSTYNGDYHIVATSPCRDAGTNDAPLISQTDMDGEARIVNGTVDIGADEFSTPHGAPGSYTVPGDYAGIQEAIDASFPGDVITVQPGTYYENLDFKGQPITLRSSAGPEQTVIHGGVGVSGNRPVVTFSFLEQSDTVLDGFTITNGTGYSVVGSNQSCGGGICCRSTRPLLMNNVVEGNSATYGGGIYSNCSNSYGSQEIVDCIIRDNDGDLGSGMHVTGYALIEGCVVKDNRSGGGIYAKTSNDDRVTIRNGLIENNDSAPGINVTGMGEAIIENSSILNNHNEEGNGGGIQLGCFVNNTIRYNTIAGNFARNGGGIYVWKKSFRIEDNTIACNIAKGSGGGMR